MEPKVEYLDPLSQLLLDPENPRLAQYGVAKDATQEDLLKTIWEQMDCMELAKSITSDEFWRDEPLIAVPNGGRYTVVEGNRRLATVLALLNQELLDRVSNRRIDRPSPKVINSITLLPVKVVESRRDAWQQIGFKHVNGPAKWSSFAKAQYIKTISDSGVPLEQISSQLGDSHRTVQRLYRAYQVLDQAENSGVWKREFAYKKHLAFSHLMTGLDYPGISAFISISDKSEEVANPVPVEKLEELGELLTWLWGDQRSDIRPVVESQNPDLRRLDKVVSNGIATERLRHDRILEVAWEESKGEQTLFTEALAEARHALARAQSRVSNGDPGTSAVLQQARELAKMALDLLDTMRSKRKSDDDLRSRLTDG